MPIHDWTRVDAGVFHDFHLSWVCRLSARLNRLLSPDHYAMIEQAAGPVGPDLLPLQPADHHDEYVKRARRVAVRRTNGDQVVAVVEVVSPGNKASQYALRSFVTKAVEYLHAGVHLLILDLLPPTPRDPKGIHPALWSEFVDRQYDPPPDKPLTLAAYAASPVLEAFVEPVAVHDPLPGMPLFFAPGRYVDLPLEPSYAAAWDEVPKRWRDVIAPA